MKYKGVLLPGESHGQRSLAGSGPWGGSELGTAEVTEHIEHTQVCKARTHTFGQAILLSRTGTGNGEGQNQIICGMICGTQ